eukprot:gnl/MRDRNA2_/MRDRNA2_24919_c0_seq1.p1 gnl/MRDRNA2_/MRDRNA2_24919_c0~~gnl/MRDRNA2_/MRDRNA2_24919_c0_seq1.p1  ORF type:complete len:262 (+),score=39.14 gnl/MRDRNA2_/MRDRNA2_24919_c0_seq1:54-839(+)
MLHRLRCSWSRCCYANHRLPCSTRDQLRWQGRSTASEPVSTLGSEGEELRTIVLDSMLPKQRLRFSCKSDQAAELPGVGETLGMLGLNPTTRTVLDAGVEVVIVEKLEGPEGTVGIEIFGQRPFRVLKLSQEEVGLRARVSWGLHLGSTKDDTADASDVRAKHAALSQLVTIWMRAVRDGGREQAPDHLDKVLEDLGPMPDDPAARALWVGALINPLPGLGVAWEIRPAVLRARTSREGVDVVLQAIKKSILHVQTGQRLF